LEWWKDSGRHILGLDIRKSAEERWEKGLRVRARSPEPRYRTSRTTGAHPATPGVTAAPTRNTENAFGEWNLRADAIALVDGETNALKFYREAAEAIKPFRRDISAMFSESMRAEPMPDGGADLDQLMQKSEAALVLIRKGLACRGCEMPRLEHVKEPLPFFPLMVQLSQLLILEGKLHESRGLARSALSSYLDVVRFSRHLGSQRLGVGAAASLRTENEGYRGIRRVLSTWALRVDTYAWLCAELLTYGDSTVSVLETVREESEVLSRSCSRMAMSDIIDEIRKGGATRPEDESQFTKDDLLLDLKQHMVVLRPWLELDYPEARRKPNPVLRHWVARNWVPSAGDLRLKRLATLSDHRGTLLLAALLRCKTETGNFPGGVHDLRPAYLENLPVDPFTEGSFSYAKEDNDCAIYSLGPDLDDDGARKSLGEPGSWASPIDGDMVYELKTGGLERAAQEEPAPSDVANTTDSRKPPYAVLVVAGAALLGIACLAVVHLARRAKRSRHPPGTSAE
jgi:hypothetical protein